uniref:McrB family protein n=1 Tax=Lentilactobacillus hilgardii TaxID=1588 RepID=UPI00403F6D83
MVKPKETLVKNLEKFAHLVGGQYRSSNLFVMRAQSVDDKLTPKSTGYNFISLIRDDQQPSGTYSGISIKVNPGIEHYRLSLDIGSEGFGDDYQNVVTPGIRRKFGNLQQRIHTYSTKNEKNIECFCALNFADDSNKPELRRIERQYAADDINSHPMDLFAVFVDKPTLADDSIDENQDFWRIYKAMISIYAEMRGWPSNQKERKNVEYFRNSVPNGSNKGNLDVQTILHLLESRHYVVLQGAPGTGKTLLASEIAEKYNSQNVIFTQFHAETTYSDFVGGYQPTEVNDKLSYRYQEGPFIKAIRRAQDAPDEKTLLIIDEINRANLSNVLGESFYLFEDANIQHRPQIILGKDGKDIKGIFHHTLSLGRLPKNLRVIATMNTADRSLAVVDFALRRRFAWYTMKPHEISNKELLDGEQFHKKEFERFQSIFEMYATSAELPLQPGQAYFITRPGQHFEERIRYELLPLIREYLESGFLSGAENQFNQFFVDEINEPIYL